MKMNFTAFALTVFLNQAALASEPVPQPEIHTEKIGNTIWTDPFRWMTTLFGESPSERLKAYVSQENAYADQYFSTQKDLTERLYEEMKKRKYESLEGELPEQEEKTRLTTYKIDAGVIVQVPPHDGEEKPILDLKSEFEDLEQITLGWVKVNPESSQAAVSVTYKGDTFYWVVDLRTLKHTKANWDKSVPVEFEWSASGDLFFLSENKAPELNLGKLFLMSASDIENRSNVVYENQDPTAWLVMTKSIDNQYIVVTKTSYENTEVFAFSIQAPHGAPVKFSFGTKPVSNLKVDHYDGRFYILKTNPQKSYSLYTLQDGMAVDQMKLRLRGDTKDKNYFPLNIFSAGFQLFKNGILVSRRLNGSPVFELYGYNFKKKAEIRFKEAYYGLSVIADQPFDVSKIRILKEGLIFPEAVYEVDAGGKVAKIAEKKIENLDPNQILTRRVSYKTRDGVSVPMVLMANKTTGFKNRPVFMSMYGGYGSFFQIGYAHAARISMTASLLDRGVVMAFPLVRGGGETGHSSYLGAFQGKKAHSSLDVIDAAEYLIQKKIADPTKIAATGFSQSGIVLGGALNLRPGLFKAIIFNMGFLDFVNTELNPSIPMAAIEWKLWGNPRNESDLAHMRLNSPYDGIRNQIYPAVLVNSAYDDWNVLYHESVKYAARLRMTRIKQNPVYLKVLEPGVGDHEGTYGDHEADMARNYAFLLDQFGIHQ